MPFSPIVIVAPPPTPNGDLHVGHLSGPYFGADVLARYARLRGLDVITALSVDLNQTYVVTTSERLGVEPDVLARRSHSEIAETLARAAIGFDIVGMPEAAYTQRVIDWFRRLHEVGLLKRRVREVLYDVARERYLFESYAAGHCPVCLAATKANICESCGHPNDAADLIGLYPTGGTALDTIERREIVEFVLELEPMRAALFDYLEHAIPERRPTLARLLAELFAKPLPDFPVTFPSAWGIPAPFAQAEGLVLNVWAEMVPGHYHWIDAACATRGFAPVVSGGQSAQYVQYLGFDNSFFYTLAHLALALAARSAGIEALLPTAFITNEFYQLDNFKFSTSQGHLIWGKDLLAEVPADELRFYLAWSNPEYNQANFTRSDMDSVLQRKFREPLGKHCDMLARLSGRGAIASVEATALLARFESAYDARRQSLRIAALTVSNGFDVLTSMANRSASPDLLRGTAQAIAVGLAPISPEAAARLWAASGASGPIKWPELARAEHAA